MSTQTIFLVQLVVGYVAWLLCFGLLPCTASASSGSSLSFQVSSAPIYPLTLLRSPPTEISQPGCWHSWRFLR